MTTVKLVVGTGSTGLDYTLSTNVAGGRGREEPASHVGKLYNVPAHKLATHIEANVDGVDEVIVRLPSSIGRPIDQPRLAAIDVVAAGGLSTAQQQQIRDFVRQQLAERPALVKELVSGTLTVF